MVAGHLREQNGIYQMILSYKDKSKKRKTKSISTHLPVKGNKKRAEAMLYIARKEFVPTLWDGDTLLWDYLTDWIDYCNYTPEQYAFHKKILKLYIVPYFQETAITIANLNVRDLEQFYKFVRSKPLSSKEDSLNRVLETCHSIISIGIDHAILSNWTQINPCKKIDPISGRIKKLFSDFILEWLEIMKSSVEETTFSGYSSGIKQRIAPYFAEKEYTLQDLEANPIYIQDYYQYELTVKHLTTNTIIHRHANIRKCLQYAVQIGLIDSNPADRIERPQKNEYSPKYYDSHELELLFRAFKNDPLEIPVLLAALYGMRRSEVVGLKWNAIDYEQKTITIKHVVTDAYINGHVKRVIKDKAKNKSSTRVYPLLPPLEVALLQLKEKQEQEQIICGNAYSLNYLDYVNRTPIGELIKPGYISQHFILVLEKNALKRIRFHDLRHTCASLLYAKEIDLKSIQAWLGHSSISTTANIYTHFDYNKKVRSANAILSTFSNYLQEGCMTSLGGM